MEFTRIEKQDKGKDGGAAMIEEANALKEMDYIKVINNLTHLDYSSKVFSSNAFLSAFPSEQRI